MKSREQELARLGLVNLDKPALRVRHADLERAHEDSVYRSRCPACKGGILLGYRDQRTFKIIDTDRCVRCGQLVIYEDAEIAGEPVMRSSN